MSLRFFFSNLSTHNRRDEHRSSMKFCKLDVGCNNILLWTAGIHIYLKWRSRMKQLAVHLLQVDTTSDHLIFVGFIMFSHVFLSSARCCGYPIHLAWRNSYILFPKFIQDISYGTPYFVGDQNDNGFCKVVGKIIILGVCDMHHFLLCGDPSPPQL